MPRVKTFELKADEVTPPPLPVLTIGDLVVALVEIAEECGDEIIIHARPGDTGTVVWIDAFWPTVQWESSATACVHGDDFITVRSFDLTTRRPGKA